MSLGLGLICFLFLCAFLGLGAWAIALAIGSIKRSRNVLNQFSDIVENERARVNSGEAQPQMTLCRYCGAAIPAGARCASCGAAE